MSCSGCLSTGLKNFAKAMIYGAAPDELQKQRLDICRGCTAVDSDGKRLYREEGAKHFCGMPRAPVVLAELGRAPTWEEIKKTVRDDTKDGCGCYLEFKVSRKESSCPLGLWKPETLNNAQEIDRVQNAPADGEIQLICSSKRPGDVITQACVIAGMKRANPSARVTWTLYQEMIEWAKLFPVADDLMPLELYAAREFKQVYSPPIQLEQHTPGINKHAFFAAHCGDGHSPAIPPMEIPSLALNYAAKHGPLLDNDKIVVICPLEPGASQGWIKRRWLELEEHLLQRGYSTIVIDPDKHGELTPAFKSARYFAPQPAELAAIFSKARLVIGGDTSLVHLAGVLGRPALSLCGPFVGADEFGFYPQVRVIQSPIICSGCRFIPENGFTRYCEAGCEAFFSIDLQSVIRNADELLAIVEYLEPSYQKA